MESFTIFKLDGSFSYDFVFAPFFKEKNGRLMHKLISHILPCLLVYCSLFLLGMNWVLPLPVCVIVHYIAF